MTSERKTPGAKRNAAASKPGEKPYSKRVNKEEQLHLVPKTVLKPPTIKWGFRGREQLVNTLLNQSMKVQVTLLSLKTRILNIPFTLRMLMFLFILPDLGRSSQNTLLGQIMRWLTITSTESRKATFRLIIK